MTITEATKTPAELAERAERVLRFRLEQDPKSEAIEAIELEWRAELLRRPRAINPAGQDYERVLARVRQATGGYRPEQIERIARRIHRTGEGVWHAAWVLFGGQNGCGCSPCSKLGPRSQDWQGADIWLSALGSVRCEAEEVAR